MVLIPCSPSIEVYSPHFAARQFGLVQALPASASYFTGNSHRGHHPTKGVVEVDRVTAAGYRLKRHFIPCHSKWFLKAPPMSSSGGRGATPVTHCSTLPLPKRSTDLILMSTLYPSPKVCLLLFFQVLLTPSYWTFHPLSARPSTSSSKLAFVESTAPLRVLSVCFSLLTLGLSSLLIKPLMFLSHLAQPKGRFVALIRLDAFLGTLWLLCVQPENNRLLGARIREHRLLWSRCSLKHALPEDEASPPKEPL